MTLSEALRTRRPYHRSHASPRARALATFYMMAIIPLHHPDGCWEWLGAMKDCRYGVKRPAIYIGNGRKAQVTMHVARFLLYVMHGIRFNDLGYRGLEAGHTCHNEQCVNPLHLKWMTRQENMDYIRERIT